MKHININKIIYIVIMTVLILSSLLSCCKATVIVDTNYEITQDPLDKRVTNLAGEVLGVVRTVGTIISVLILAVIGLEYMIASPENKADYKKNMYPYLIGAAFVFVGSTIPKFIFDVLK